MKALGLNNIRATNQYLEQLSGSEPFHLIVLYNVINHLDEAVVQRLLLDADARERYLPILNLLRGLLVMVAC